MLHLFITTDDQSLQIKSFATITLGGVSTKLLIKTGEQKNLNRIKLIKRKKYILKRQSMDEKIYLTLSTNCANIL